jgi:hypothetical protein
MPVVSPGASILAGALAVLLGACAARDDVRRRDAEPAAAQTSTPGGAAAGRAPPVRVEGHEPDAQGLVNVRALELACLADPTALTHPKAVRARFDDLAGRQLVPVGELAFVLLARDPKRSLTEPPPHLCRTIASSTVLRAPLMRAHEPAARWLVRRLAGSLVDDTAFLLRDGAHRELAHTAPPRIIVDDAGVLVAVALPVALAGGG